MDSTNSGSGTQSVVSSCDVTNCTYNRERSCHAGSIQVAMIDNMAHCATYTPRDGAMGIAADQVQDTATKHSES